MLVLLPKTSLRRSRGGAASRPRSSWPIVTVAVVTVGGSFSSEALTELRSGWWSGPFSFLIFSFMHVGGAFIFVVAEAGPTSKQRQRRSHGFSPPGVLLLYFWCLEFLLLSFW